MRKGIRGVLFDVDDTLVNSRPAMEHALRIIAGRMAEFAGSQGPEQGVQRIHAMLRELDDSMHAAFRYNRDEWWQEAARRLGKEMPADLASRLTRDYWNIVLERSELYPDALPTLEYLMRGGYLIGAVTDTDGTKGIKLERLRRMGLMRFFRVVVVGGEDTKGVKPDPEPFLLAAARLGLKPDECVMVGDRPHTDVRGARTAGMRAIWLRRREWNAMEPCDAIIDSLNQLPEHLG
ncbi:MAG: HAD-IA family hydrolase [Candidatus Hadarchaeales archaeon]